MAAVSFRFVSRLITARVSCSLPTEVGNNEDNISGFLVEDSSSYSHDMDTRNVPIHFHCNSTEFYQ